MKLIRRHDGWRDRWRRIQPTEDQPWVTAALMVFLTLCFAGQVLVRILWSVDAGMVFGVNRWLIEQGQIYRLLSGVLVHADGLHLAMNLIVLQMLGSIVEMLAGRFRFFVVFIVSGLMGSAFSALLNSLYALSVGASGAISGLLGYLIAAKLSAPGSVPRQWSTWAYGMLLMNIVWNISGSEVLDVWGHLGGFVGGMVSVWLVGLPLHARTRAAGMASLSKRYLSFALAILLVTATLALPIRPGLEYVVRSFAQVSAGDLSPNALHRWLVAESARREQSLPWDSDSYGRWIPQYTHPSVTRHLFETYGQDPGMAARPWSEWLQHYHIFLLTAYPRMESQTELTALTHPQTPVQRIVLLWNDQELQPERVEAIRLETPDGRQAALNILLFSLPDDFEPSPDDTDTKELRLEMFTGAVSFSF